MTSLLRQIFANCPDFGQNSAHAIGPVQFTVVRSHSHHYIIFRAEAAVLSSAFLAVKSRWENCSPGFLLIMFSLLVITIHLVLSRSSKEWAAKREAAKNVPQYCGPTTKALAPAP